MCFDVRRLRLLLLALSVAMFAGCATLPPDATPAQKADPFEAWNRKVFDFNDDLDKAILKPIATAYAQIVPPIVRRGVDNFYANMADAWSAVNSLLQGKPFIALQSAFRFAVNSTFGILGIIDVAADMDIERHPEDFGQTLGVWGAEPGPYLVWPIIGSSTVRDSIALPLDYAMSPMNLLNGGATPFAIWGLRLVNTRAGLLDATDLLDQIALDRYNFIRDGYLQRRGSMIRDGEPEPFDDPSRDDEAPDAPAAPASAASSASAAPAAPAASAPSAESAPPAAAVDSSASAAAPAVPATVPLALTASAGVADSAPPAALASPSPPAAPAVPAAPVVAVAVAAAASAPAAAVPAASAPAAAAPAATPAAQSASAPAPAAAQPPQPAASDTAK